MKETKIIFETLDFEQLPILSEFVKKLGTTVLGTTDTEDLMHISNYTLFITQPLTKGMFIPTGEDREVLEEPENVKCCSGFECGCQGREEPDGQEVFEYLEAKSKVLFEGWECIADGERLTAFVIFEGPNSTRIDFIGGICKNYATVEQAINNGVKLKLKQ